MKSFRSNNSKKLLAVLISAIATGGLFGINPASALSPPNINNDISWGTKAGENGIGYQQFPLSIGNQSFAGLRGL